MAVCFVNGQNKAVVSQVYSLDGDFNAIRATAHIHFELTHVVVEPSIVIETEQWVHTGGYITVSTRPDYCLEIRLSNGFNYPEIRVLVNYRTPLVRLEIDSVTSMISKNAIFSKSSSVLNIMSSGSSIGLLTLQHDSDIVIAISGTGRLTVSGQVQGIGQLSASGSAQLIALSCPMKKVSVALSGTGYASVYGIEGVSAVVSGTGTICYRGPLLSQSIAGLGSIQQCTFEETTKESEHSSSKSNELMGTSQRLVMIVANTIVFNVMWTITN